MKTISKSILCVAAMFAAAACMQETFGPGEEQLKEMTFSAVVDGVVDAPAAKTHLASDYSVVWDQMDDISVFSGENTHTRFVAAALDGDKAIFSGLGAEAETYYAVYPYADGNSRNGSTITTTLPTLQKAVAGTFDKKMNLSAAKSATTDLEFKNLGAIIGFSVQGTGVNTVTLESLDGQTLMSGAVSVDFSGETPAMTVATSGGENYVQLSAPDGGFNAQSTYYFVVAPGTYNGFKLSFVNTLSGTYSQETTSTVSVSRNGHKNLGTFVIEDTDWAYTDDGNYTVNGRAAVDAFIAEHTGSPVEAVNLTIKGEDVGNEQLALISDAIRSVSGTLTLDGIKDGWLEPNKLLNKIDFKDLVIKNITSGTIDLRHMSFTVYPGDLVLENINDLACADWVYNQVVEGSQNSLHLVTEVKGDLTVRNVHKMGQYNFIALKKVGGSLTIDTGRSSGDNPGENYGGMGLGIEEIGGDLVLINNPINTLDGFDCLTSIGGNVVLTNNNNLPMATDGGRIGYCIIKNYIDNGVIRSGATVSITHNGSPVDVSTLTSCESAGGGDDDDDEEIEYDLQNLVLEGPDAVTAFVNSIQEGKVKVGSLTLKGAGIHQGHLSDLANKISKVEGDFTLEEVGDGGWMNVSNFFAFVDCQGGIVIRKPSAVIEFKWHGKTVINGDLILDRVGDLATASWVNEGLCDIEEIKGDLWINGTGKIGEHTFRKLKKVGGDVSIIGIWAGDGHSGTDFGAAGMSLESIGGDLYLDGFPLESLGGFDALQSLGGNVILNLSNISATSQDGKVGYCIFKDYLTSGVMSAGATIRVNGTDVTSSLQGCN